MVSLSLLQWRSVDSLGEFIALASAAFLAKIIYDVFFHPLRGVPGPFLAKFSSIPNWYQACTGKRHIWIWQQFQMYGYRIRVAPNVVLFCDPAAYADIYGTKSNVRRSDLYTSHKRSEDDRSVLNTVDVAEHARKRKLLGLVFTEKSIRAASHFVIKHVDRWNQLLVSDVRGNEWSDTIDFAHATEALTFDIMGDLSFGKSTDIKEPGDNPIKDVPQSIVKYLQFIYPIGHSPLLGLILWLKPRGLNALLRRLTPPAALEYAKFAKRSVAERRSLHKLQSQMPDADKRQDIFYFLSEARDPATGEPAYRDEELESEARLLIVAGTDTTSISLSGIFFYLTGDTRRLKKLTDEIRTTFDSVEGIVHGPTLFGCTYLKACIDEGMRLCPSDPSELPRQVLPGGITIKGEFYPAGTVVGCTSWSDTRNQLVYGDPEVFRPERWIVDEETGVTKEDVARARSSSHPFSAGAGSCLGKNLAMMEMMIVIARTLYRLDVRRTPGSTLACGRPSMGWGSRDPRQYQLKDALVAIREGPELQFRPRT